MSTPFFSIVIPTRNRGPLLLEAVQSVLLQNFTNYEIIVSDNSSNHEAYSLLTEAGYMNKIKYVRPASTMTMPDHWDFASTHALGKYVLFVADRSVLVQGALTIIYENILKHSKEEPLKICSWSWALYDDSISQLISEKIDYKEGSLRLYSSEEAVEEYLKSIKLFPYSLPRGLNSCYLREYGEELRSTQGSLFKPINPDFSSAFQLLAHSKNLLFIQATLFLSRGLNLSNGGNAYQEDGRDYLYALGENGKVKRAPLKAALMENVVYEDFLKAREELGGSLKSVDLHTAEYFLRIYNEIQEKRGIGVFDSTDIENYFSEWKTVFSQLNSADQNKIKAGIASNVREKLKFYLRQLPLGKWFFSMLRDIRIKSKRFPNSRSTAMATAGFHEKL